MVASARSSSCDQKSCTGTSTENTWSPDGKFLQFSQDARESAETEVWLTAGVIVLQTHRLRQWIKSGRWKAIRLKGKGLYGGSFAGWALDGGIALEIGSCCGTTGYRVYSHLPKKAFTSLGSCEHREPECAAKEKLKWLLHPSQ